MFNITSKYFSFFNNKPLASWFVHITRDFLTCYSCSYYISTAFLKAMLLLGLLFTLIFTIRYFRQRCKSHFWFETTQNHDHESFDHGNWPYCNQVKFICIIIIENVPSNIQICNTYFGNIILTLFFPVFTYSSPYGPPLVFWCFQGDQKGT